MPDTARRRCCLFRDAALHWSRASRRGIELSSNVIKFRKPTAAEKSKGKTLCREGFHKWAIRQDKQFDVRQGRLVTVYACVRCGATKTEAR